MAVGIHQSAAAAHTVGEEPRVDFFVEVLDFALTIFVAFLNRISQAVDIVENKGIENFSVITHLHTHTGF